MFQVWNSNYEWQVFISDSRVHVKSFKKKISLELANESIVACIIRLNELNILRNLSRRNNQSAIPSSKKSNLGLIYGLSKFLQINSSSPTFAK